MGGIVVVVSRARDVVLVVRLARGRAACSLVVVVVAGLGRGDGSTRATVVLDVVGVGSKPGGTAKTGTAGGALTLTRCCLCVEEKLKPVSVPASSVRLNAAAAARNYSPAAARSFVAVIIGRPPKVSVEIDSV